MHASRELDSGEAERCGSGSTMSRLYHRLRRPY